MRFLSQTFFLKEHVYALRKMILFCCGLLFLSQSAFSFSPESERGTDVPTFSQSDATPQEFKIVGYMRDKTAKVSDIQFDKLTHINYAFVLPKRDGTLREIFFHDKLAEVVEKAHAHNVQVLISVGGYGYHERFEEITARDLIRAKFIKELVTFVNDHNLDGVDLDWEFPSPDPREESAENYLLLLQELDKALGDKLLTAAVMVKDSRNNAILPGVFEVVDFVNIMAYGGANEEHGRYHYAVEALEYWRGRGIPPSQLVLGLPFYAQPYFFSYNELVEIDPKAPYLSTIEYNGTPIFYNGIPDIKRKTKLAMEQASGVMIWSLGKDTVDDTSLLNAVYQTAYGTKQYWCEIDLPPLIKLRFLEYGSLCSLRNLPCPY